jgi:hypothetical protein
LARALVDGLVCRSPERRRNAARFLSEDFLEENRKHVSAKRDFHVLQRVIRSVSLNREAVGAVIEYFESVYPDATGLQAALAVMKGERPLRALVARTGHEDERDLYHSVRLKCCVFEPSGEQRHACHEYLADPGVRLVHVLPTEDGQPASPVAVAIVVDVCALDGQPGLLLDSAHYGREARQCGARNVHLCLARGAMELAARTDAAFVVANGNVEQNEARLFARKCGQMKGAEAFSGELVKCRGSMTGYLEAWGDPASDSPCAGEVNGVLLWRRQRASPDTGRGAGPDRA